MVFEIFLVVREKRVIINRFSNKYRHRGKN